MIVKPTRRLEPLTPHSASLIGQALDSLVRYI